MENQNQPQSMEESAESKRPGMLALVTGVFYEPSRIFKTLIKKTDWIVPLILIAVIGGTLGYITRPIIAVDQGKQIKRGVEKYKDVMPPERYEETMKRIDEGVAESVKNEFKWYYPLISIGFPFVLILIITLICWMTGNFIFGGKAGFWVVFNVVAFAALVGLLGDAIRGLLMISKETMHVYTGLGLLRSTVGPDSFLFYLFRQIDIFSIWRIIVTCIGLGAVYNMKSGKFIYVIFAFWAIFISLVAFGNATILAGAIVY